ncbi:MAG: metal-dependent transcriptional regulator [Ruminococcus sp.]|nr:metal-dependent transcriptional regulator [Ruminococcus sp.]MBP3798251.1 metal-dependent transcriptional regulator [Ruminococcus sp.]MBQ1432619.1 metal-dependent transcriptional regulator [Ruminococcus sp.]
MKIQESAENYLESILMISERKGEVRSIDIVNELEFSKPSVSIAMKNLRENGYILVDKDGYITLTDKGMAIAKKMYERHKLFTHLFEKLGVDPKIAAKDACRVEHILSDETFAAIKAYISKIDAE